MNSHGWTTKTNIRVINSDGTIDKSKSLDVIDNEEKRDELEITVKDSKGEVQQRVTQPFRSWNAQYQYLNDYMYRSGVNATTLGAILDSDGNSRNTVVYGFMVAAGNVGVTTRGIRVGRSGAANTTAVSYHLVDAYANGTATNQFSHGAMRFNAPTPSGSGWVYSLLRTFQNASASAIVVRETALYVWDVQNSWTFCIARDIVDSTGGTLAVTVASGGAIEIRYNFYLDGTNGLTKNFLMSQYYGMTGTTVGIFPTVYNTDFTESGTTLTASFTFAGAATDNMKSTNAGQGIDYAGIVLGASSTPFSVWNHRLDGIFGHSEGANSNLNTLYHETSTTVSLVRDVGGTSFNYYAQRGFINNNLSAVTVREIGIYTGPGGTNAIVSARASNSMCWMRQVIPDLVLDPGQQVQVRWTMGFVM